MSLLGRPIIILPYGGKPGCLAQVGAFLRTWLVRALFAGGFFLLGFGLARCTA